MGDREAFEPLFFDRSLLKGRIFVYVTKLSTVADSQTLSRQFLDLYLQDPSKNPFGQFYTTPYAGSLVGELPRAYEQYGALVNPNEIAQQLLAAGGIREVGQAARDLAAQTRGLRRANYESYKQPYTQAQELFRQQRATGFESPEAEEQARQGLAAVREATFLPYLAKRGYLEAQEKLQESGIRQAKKSAIVDRLKESMAARGMSAQDIKKRTGGFRKSLRGERERGQLGYEAVKDVGRGGEVELGNRLSLGESLKKMMTEAQWAPTEQAWYDENRGGQRGGAGMGYESRPGASSGSSNVVEAQPRAQEPTAGPGLGGQIAGVASAVGEAVRSGAPRLDLGVGGRGDVLNRRDIRAARESGMSRRDIRQAVKEGDIRMSAKARAQLFRNK